MKKKFFVMAALTFILIPVLLAACSQQESEPGNKFSSKCQQMKTNIEKAQAAAVQLEDFNWDEFSEIGILYPPQGVCPVGNLPIVEKASVDKGLADRVVDLASQLPDPQTAETYSVQCTKCLNLATELCSNKPYGAISINGSENLTTRWQQSCSQLQSALHGAEYLASRDKTIAADYTFPKLFSCFTASDDKIKQKYLNKFTTISEEYIKLHDDLINNVQEAEQAVTDLSNWQSFSLDATSSHLP